MSCGEIRPRHPQIRKKSVIFTKLGGRRECAVLLQGIQAPDTSNSMKHLSDWLSEQVSSMEEVSCMEALS